MNILHANPKILNIRCHDKDNTKEQGDCISGVFPSKKNGWVKWRESKV